MIYLTLTENEAEIVEKAIHAWGDNGASVLAKITKAMASRLPEICASRLEDGSEMPILIKCGETGYWPAPGLDVDRFNAHHGVTPAQKMAMEVGSHFGFHVHAADPSTYVDLS